MGSPYSTFQVATGTSADPVLKQVAAIIERQITRRCGARPAHDTGSWRLALSVDPSLPEEAYRIEAAGPHGVAIAGGSARGVLYGAGKFLRNACYHEGGFTPGDWHGQSAPQCPFRAIYLASHFHNFYEDAPRDEVIDYIHELGLWGYNTIAIYYPTDQYTGPDDPASTAWLAKFKDLMGEVRACGLQVALTMVPNHCFKPAPAALARTPMSGQSNHGEGICISKPGGREFMVGICRWLMEQFKDIGLDYALFGPYDDGGCGCAECWPWGPKGFVTIARDFAREIRTHYPACRIVLHTWCFESENAAGTLGEWEGLDARLRDDPGWVDYIMADGHDDYFPAYPLEVGVPGGLPLTNFPEISMFGMFPWGGYGTNAAPAHFQKLWDRVKSAMAGGMPYSEGIYEDLNKAIVAGFYWDKNRSAEDTVREYAAYEFGPAAAERVLEMVRIFEANHNRHFIAPNAAHAYELATALDSELTDVARRGWRWRLVYLRALIDHEMQQSPTAVTERLKTAFAELTTIYHATGANERVKPLQGTLSQTGQISPRHSPFVKQWHLSELQPPADLGTLPGATLADALGWQHFVVPWFIVENDFISLHDLHGTQDGIVYLANRFSVTESSDWILHVGHDGGAKAWVDGHAVFCSAERQNPAPTTRSQATVQLDAGAHEIVIAFDTDQGNGWGLYFCFERPATTAAELPFPQCL